MLLKLSTRLFYFCLRVLGLCSVAYAWSKYTNRLTAVDDDTADDDPADDHTEDNVFDLDSIISAARTEPTSTWI